MLNWLRMHWFELGIFLSLPIIVYLVIGKVSEVGFILWISLITLFIHQFEEYRYPGYFPGMMNTVMFSSKKPDRYPLNTNTALIVNTVVGWLIYFLAAVFTKSLIWIGIATILVSLGNFVAHTFVFNIKGKTKYNPGMLTAIIFFLPISVYFFYIVLTQNLATLTDWILGIIFGIFLNIFGVIGLIIILKNEDTSFIFPERCLIPSMRN